MRTGGGDPEPEDPATRFARVAEAFSRAREIVGGEREGFLGSLVDDVRREVEELLAASDGPEDALSDHRIEGRRGGVPWSAGRAVPDEDCPERIGTFRVLRRLGRGGMGVVYEAEQEAPRRRVALKLVRPGLAFGEGLRRFRHEAEALGRLKHPGIAQIFEVGTCDLGHGEQPYFVMELVEGQPLLVHAREARLDRAARLRLVAELCDAVQHAHERGVVHRDLKPDNVLVDASGRAKVLDFGVARVRADDVPLTTIHTAQGQIVGTLTHMAPEQLAGDPDSVGPAVDVYALGVIAFELLTGRLPHEVAGLSLTQAVRHITEVEPPKLGTLDRGLRGDLETIVAKALEPDPARRYVTAAALASDLRRFLAHEPIAARRPSLPNRAVRFTRRHPGLVGGVAVAVLAVAVGVAVTLSYARREARSRRDAERAGIDARAVSLASIGSALDRGDSWPAREFLDRIPLSLRAWEWGWLSRRAPWLLDGRAHPSAFLGHRLVTVTPIGGEYVRLASIDLDDPLGKVVCFPDDGRVYGFAPGRDGLLAAVFLDEGHKHGDVALLDLPRGTILSRFPVSDPGYALALAADGTILLRCLRVFRRQLDGTWSSLQLQAPSNEVCQSVHLSPDGRYVAFGTCSGRLLLLDATTGELVAERRSSGCTFTRFLDDGEHLVSAMPGVLELLTLPSLELQRRTPLPEAEVLWVAYDQHGTVALATRGAGILVVDPASGEVRERLVDGRFTVKSIEFVSLSQDGRFLSANAGETDRAWIHELGAPPEEPYLALSHDETVLGATFAPDGLTIATTTATRLHMWDAENGAALASIDWPDGTQQPTLPLFSADGARLVTLTQDGKGTILLSCDLANGFDQGRPVLELTGELGFTPASLSALDQALGGLPRSLGSQARVLPGGSEVLQISTKGSVVRTSLGRSRQSRDRWGNAASLDLSPDGQLLACADKGSLRILEVESGAEVAVTLETREQMGFLDIAWSPDGSRLAAARQDGRLFLVETREFREVLELPRGSGPLRFLTWSPDGTRLLAIDGTTLRLHDSLPAIPRRLRAEARARSTEERSTRLETLALELSDEKAAVEALFSESAGDEGLLVAARRAALRRLASHDGPGLGLNDGG